MIIVDENNNILENKITSFEICYLSIFGKKIKEEKLLSLLNKKDNGLIRFYPKSLSYGPDMDDTSLFYISLIKKNKKYIKEAKQIIKQSKNYLFNNLIITWPHREKKLENIDPVVNLHYLWMLNLCNISDTEIEKYLLNWLNSNDIKTLYYHNEKFIINTCNKASKDFINKEFKTKFEEMLLIKINENNFKIKEYYKELNFEDGCFRHIGKPVFFHFFKNKNMNKINNNDYLKNYYKNKKIDYSYINNDLEILKKNDFLKFFINNKIYKISIFDEVLTKNFSKIIKEYDAYIKSNFNMPNIENKIIIQKDKKVLIDNEELKSMIIFILSIGNDLNNANLTFDEEKIDFPMKVDFFGIHINPKNSIKFEKKDNNNYIYFIYNLKIISNDNNFFLINKI